MIPISIGQHDFSKLVCELGASVNIMPKVILDRIFPWATLLYKNMCLQLTDHTVKHPKGILYDVCIGVGQSYVPVDFVVLDTGKDPKSPFILSRPFLSTTKVAIYVDMQQYVSLSRVMKRNLG